MSVRTNQHTDHRPAGDDLPDCHWNLKDPRSCLEPDSCGCYVDPCVYFEVAPEDCCIDADVCCAA
jgi:hypothetical protein